MVTQKQILDILNKLKKSNANTSLALIACILKGDRNSICTLYSDFNEFGSMNDKAIKNIGDIFDDLIDKKFITVINTGVFKKYEISQKGIDFLDNPEENDHDKYYSSVGSASDFLEENLKLENTYLLIDNEVINIQSKMYNVKPGDTGSDYDEIEDINNKKHANNIFENQIKDLKGIKIKPYFGRMDLLKSSNSGIDVLQLYIGDQNLTIDSNQIVVNWRADIADYFYKSNTSFEHKKSKYELHLKRNIDIENYKIKSIFNQLTKKKSELKDTISDPFLASILKKKKDTPYFTDIIASIQEKQNAIIRLPYSSNIIVQGCAGSGKTMILLHRLSYLLYHNKNLKPDTIKIITPSKLFDEFVNDLSNQLGLDKIDRFTITQMYIEHINQYYPIKKISSFKNENTIDYKVLEKLYSNDLINSLTNLIKKQMYDDISVIEKSKKVELDTRYTNYLFLKNEINELIDDKFKNAIDRIRQYIPSDSNLLKILTYDQFYTFKDQLDNFIDNNTNIDLKIQDLNEKSNLIIQKLQSVDEIINDKFVSEIIDVSKSHKIKLFSNNKVSLEQYLNEYKSKLKESYKSNLSSFRSELSKLNEQILTDNEIRNLQKVRKYLIENVIPIVIDVERKKSILQEMIDKNKMNYEKELDNIEQNIKLLMSYVENYGKNIKYIQEILKNLGIIKNSESHQFLDFSQCFESLVIDEISKLFIESDIKIRFHNQYKYYFFIKLALMNQLGFTFQEHNLIMIDEAQEYAISEINLLKTIHATAVFNLFGDTNQLTTSIGTSNWEDIDASFKYYKLNENYRNPIPLVEYINNQFDLSMIPLGLEYGEVTLNIFPQGKRIDAVIFCSDDRELFINKNKIPTNEIGEERILHIEDAKGLEFNTVVVFSNNMTKNQKYVAFSRALEYLFIVE